MSEIKRQKVAKGNPPYSLIARSGRVDSGRFPAARRSTKNEPNKLSARHLGGIPPSAIADLEAG
jgi:hypothetical protein